MKAWPVRNLNPDDPVSVNARKILRVRMGELYGFEPAIAQPQNRSALHDMRIAAKRLRYSLELFRPILGEPGERNIQRVKTLQKVLGNIHDVDVRIELIQDELSRLAVDQINQLGEQLRTSPIEMHPSILTRSLRPPPDDPRRGLIALLGRQYAEGHEHYLEFKTLWDRYEQEGMREELALLSSLNFET